MNVEIKIRLKQLTFKAAPCNFTLHLSKPKDLKFWSSTGVIILAIALYEVMASLK